MPWPPAVRSRLLRVWLRRSETALGHGLIAFDPDTDSGELHGCQKVVVALVIARRYGAELFDFVEEAFDVIALSIKFVIERWEALTRRHQPYIGNDTARGHLGMQRVAIVSAVGEQNLPRTQRGEHIGSRAPVMGLTGGEFEADRSPPAVDQGMDLGRQAAARTTHAIGSPPFLGPFAPCWCTRIEDESIICTSPS